MSLPKEWIVKIDPDDTDRLVKLLNDNGYKHGKTGEPWPKSWADSFKDGVYSGEPSIHGSEEGKSYAGSAYSNHASEYVLISVRDLEQGLSERIPWFDGGKAMKTERRIVLDLTYEEAYPLKRVLGRINDIEFKDKFDVEGEDREVLRRIYDELPYKEDEE